jgi:hypothetical protein
LQELDQHPKFGDRIDAVSDYELEMVPQFALRNMLASDELNERTGSVPETRRLLDT